MADPARARKLAVRIRQIVSAAIETQVKDPRLGMVTVTDARVTSDLREATVFYTVYGDATQVEDSARALTSATGVLRSTVGKQTGIKFVPTLTFVADHVPDTARELDEALERVGTPTPSWPASARARSTPATPTPTVVRPRTTTRTSPPRRTRPTTGPPMTVPTCPLRAGASHERERPRPEPPGRGAGPLRAGRPCRAGHR
jgi:ribosome-binding factor A